MDAGLRVLEGPNPAGTRGQLDIQECCQVSPLSGVYPQLSFPMEALGSKSQVYVVGG